MSTKNTHGGRTELVPPAPALGTLHRASLKEMTVEKIQEAIAAGQLKPGDPITELGLARTFGVAQATIREALIELEHQGFVERPASRKTCITSLTGKQIDDIYLVRVRLETLAIELLATAGSPPLERCRAKCGDMLRAARAGDAVAFYQADLDFHRELWRATANACLADTLERMVPKIFAFGIMHHSRPSRRKLVELAGMHARLLDMVAAGERDNAKRFMESSMEQAWSDDLKLS